MRPGDYECTLSRFSADSSVALLRSSLRGAAQEALKTRANRTTRENRQLPRCLHSQLQVPAASIQFSIVWRAGSRSQLCACVGTSALQGAWWNLSGSRKITKTLLLSPLLPGSEPLDRDESPISWAQCAAGESPTSGTLHLAQRRLPIAIIDTAAVNQWIFSMRVRLRARVRVCVCVRAISGWQSSPRRPRSSLPKGRTRRSFSVWCWRRISSELAKDVFPLCAVRRGQLHLMFQLPLASAGSEGHDGSFRQSARPFLSNTASNQQENPDTTMSDLSGGTRYSFMKVTPDKEPTNLISEEVNDNRQEVRRTRLAGS